MAEKLETTRFLHGEHESQSSISINQAENLKSHKFYSEPRTAYFKLLSHALVFLLTSTIWLTIFFSRGKDCPRSAAFDLGVGKTIFKGHEYIGCGTSLEEAYRQGCVYDMLANHFVHRLCYDEDAINEYQAEGSTWKGYMDMNWTEPIPTTPKAMGEAGVYWTNQRDHIVHCAMLWKKQWRAFSENRRYMDAIIVSEEHVAHCTQFLMDMTEEKDFDWRQQPMTVEVGFAGCVDMGSNSLL